MLKILALKNWLSSTHINSDSLHKDIALTVDEVEKRNSDVILRLDNILLFHHLFICLLLTLKRHLYHQFQYFCTFIKLICVRVCIQMSYLHASWERQEDIERVDAQAKMKIKRFMQAPQAKGILGTKVRSVFFLTIQIDSQIGSGE